MGVPSLRVTEQLPQKSTTHRQHHVVSLGRDPALAVGAHPGRVLQEVGGAALEPVVEVDHESLQTLVSRRQHPLAVIVRREVPAGIVLADPERRVEPGRGGGGAGGVIMYHSIWGQCVRKCFKTFVQHFEP